MDEQVRAISGMGSPPSLLPECFCPISHPAVSSNNVSLCEDHTAASTVLRINTNSHAVQLALDGSSSTWWQSENGIQEVNVTINFDNSLQVYYISLHFPSLTPYAMVIYYSSDGITFTPRQYFAFQCSFFNLPDNGILTSSTDVNCLFTQNIPLYGRYVEFRLLDASRPGAGQYHENEQLRQFSLTRMVRIQMYGWHTYQGRQSDERTRYFAINKIHASGEVCFCSGHGSTCNGFICNCEHNTMGNNCEECQPLYNNRPWTNGTISAANECEMCQCYNHASSCIYDSNLGMGRCIDCADNTQGPQCEQCIPYFYNPAGIPLDSPETCVPCSCDQRGITNDGVCEQDGTGQCSCKLFVTGRTCDTCQNGYFNLSGSNQDGCQSCACSTSGTVGGSTACLQDTGQCDCLPNVGGLRCDNIIILASTDADIGSNSALQHSITGDNQERLSTIHPTNLAFSITSTDGSITVSNPMDKESTPTIEFPNMATDAGKPWLSSTAHVSVMIFDENANQPTFPPGPTKSLTSHDSTPVNSGLSVLADVEEVSVSETTAPNMEILTDVATDADIGSKNSALQHSITGGKKEGRFTIDLTSVPFSITSTDGSITVSNPIDQETTSTIDFREMATDAGKPSLSSTARVSVMILDENANQPTFPPAPTKSLTIPESTPVNSGLSVLADVEEVSVSETTAPNVEIPTVAATDADIGSKNSALHHSITDGNQERLSTIHPTNVVFSITSTDGSITVSNPMDQETTPTIEFPNMATDAGKPSLSSTARVSVMILDENANQPTFPPAPTKSLTIPESTPVNSGLSVLADVEEVSVSETTAPNMEIPTVAATDADIGSKNSALHHSITGGNQERLSTIHPTNVVFSITSTDGSITVSNPMDQETTPTIEFPNMATDAGKPSLSSTARVSVMILDENANQPTFPPAPTKSLTIPDSTPVNSGLSVLADVEEVSVSETTAPNVEIPTVAATDADIGSKNSALHHSITGGNQERLSTIHPTNVVFSITSTDGSITVSNPMDQETTPTIEFPNMVTDGEEPWSSSTAHVSVMILDDNANQPAFPPGPTKSLTIPESTPVNSGMTTLADVEEVSVSETTAPNMEIPTVTTTDADIGSKNSALHHSITDGNQERLSTIHPTNVVFSITSTDGSITVSNPMDQESTRTIEFPNMATDAGKPSLSSTARVSVMILDENANQPTFPPAPTKSLTIPESTPVNSGLSVLADVEEVSVSETTAPNMEIPTVAATDADIGSKNSALHHSITGGNQERLSTIHPTNVVFSITSTDGSITVSNPMDQETTPTIEFPNMATDAGKPSLSSTARVSVMILDENANQPTFPPAPTKSLTIPDSTPVNSGLSVLADVEEVSVSETTAPNVEIPTVAATDADIGSKNSALHHSITGGNQERLSTIHPTNVVFSITSTDGSITVSNPMDQETTPTIEFPNMATDAGKPSLSSTARVSVMILDENANQPTFPPAPTKSLTIPDSTPVNSGLSVLADVEEVSVSETTAPNVEIPTVAATDADIGSKNSALHHSITGGNQERLSTIHPTNVVFSITSTDGSITVSNPMDQETTPTIEFPNMVTDGEEPWSSSTAHVSVMILDDNANQPTFPPGPTKSLTIPESTPVNSGMTTLADVEEVSVSETTAPNMEIPTVTTTDADIGSKNSALHHSITGGNQERLSTIHPTNVVFSITSTDGSIAVSNPMDQESTRTIEFPNMATDGEEQWLSSTARVSVMILDDNANQPAFPPGPTKSLTSHESTPVKSGLSVLADVEEVSVSETTSPNVEILVITVTTTDADIGGKNSAGQHSITGGNQEGHSTIHPTSVVFSITSTDGSITVSNPMDQETTPTIEFPEMATDGREPPLTSTTSVSVTNEGDNSSDAAGTSCTPLYLAVCILVFTFVAYA